MRTTFIPCSGALAMALAIWPISALSQSGTDFVFDDEEGHLVVRFAGTAPADLDESQRHEVLNSELSSMVHDRLHADIRFLDEARDPAWARSMEPRIAEHVRDAGPEFSDIFVECRAETCRVIMEQPGRWTIPAQQAVLETVQESLETFLGAHRQQFEPAFMITAYYQDFETPHIKAFLRRRRHADADLPSGG